MFTCFYNHMIWASVFLKTHSKKLGLPSATGNANIHGHSLLWESFIACTNFCKRSFRVFIIITVSFPSSSFPFHLYIEVIPSIILAQAAKSSSMIFFAISLASEIELAVTYTQLNFTGDFISLVFFANLSNSTLETSIEKFAGRNFSEFKQELSELLVNKIIPISEEIKKLVQDQSYLDSILLDGIEKANKIASKKIKKIKETVGF